MTCPERNLVRSIWLAINPESLARRAGGHAVLAAVCGISLAVGTEAARGDFTAYNDCVYTGTYDDLNNAANVTRFNIGSSSPGPASGLLTNLSDGAATAVTVTLTASSSVSFSTGAGLNCLAGTDAATTFGGKAGLRGNQGLGSSAGGWADVTFSNLDSNKTYTFAATANRAGSSTADGQTTAPTPELRWTRFTISDVDSCTNASSAGVNVIADTGTNSSVSFCTGENTTNGYVARWTGIRSGADRTFKVRAENEGLNGHLSNSCYGFAVFMLQEQTPGAPTVSITNHPFVGVTRIIRVETSPRPIKMNVIDIDLSAPGLRFKLTPHSGPQDTMKQSTLQFLTNQNAQIAINAHFFEPWPPPSPDDGSADLVGIAASEGDVYSPFLRRRQTANLDRSYRLSR
jgi:hypothetical protein